ncbi:MAG: hypothetical protein ACYC0J_09745 [Gammaproteobacteria bacterium]
MDKMILGKIFDKIKPNEGALFGGAMVGLFSGVAIAGLLALAISVISGAVCVALVVGGPVIGMIGGPLIALAIVKGANKLRSRTNPATVPASASSALLATSSTTASYGTSHNVISTAMAANPVPQQIVSANVSTHQANANEESMPISASFSDNDVDLDCELGAGQYAPGKHYENGMPNSPKKINKI